MNCNITVDQLRKDLELLTIGNIDVSGEGGHGI